MDGFPAIATVEPDLSDLPVRFSHLRAYGACGAKGAHARRSEMQPTYAMQRGTAVHALVFNTREVCGYPGAVRSGKAYEAFVADHPDHEILTMKEFDRARYMADAVLNCADAAPLLKGVQETTMWFDWMGRKCRATPDNRGSDFVTELKSTSNLDPEVFKWHARRMAYPAQLWFQHIGAELSGFTVKKHYIVGIEDRAPWICMPFEVRPRALDRGARLVMLWMERLKVAEDSRQYPPYAQGIVPLDEPVQEDEALVFEDDDESDDKPSHDLNPLMAG